MKGKKKTSGRASAWAAGLEAGLAAALLLFLAGCAPLLYSLSRPAAEARAGSRAGASAAAPADSTPADGSGASAAASPSAASSAADGSGTVGDAGASPGASPTAAPADDEPLPYRAIWLSYLEWQGADFSSETGFTAWLTPVLDNCAALGIRTVIAQVRPFGDALYPSKLFPFSHLCTGVQGVDPGFDPLAVLLAAAKARGLRVEAWINPYRLSAGGIPGVLADTGLAATHPDWVKTVGGGQYLDPALPAVQEYIAAGVAELCQNYAVDAVQFDDYFYPTTDAAFDETSYAAYRAGAGGQPLPLADWRRRNVNDLIGLCWRTVHKTPGVAFGVAPQGNPDNNYAAQYSDAALWLREPGYVDYLLPQLYWGQQYRSGGADRFALGNIAAEWLALPRAESVRLYFGLGAFRLGEGDGSAPANDEWQSGHALADQTALLAGLGADGAAYYRYASLFDNPARAELAAQERENLSQMLSDGNFHL